MTHKYIGSLTDTYAVNVHNFNVKNMASSVTTAKSAFRALPPEAQANLEEVNLCGHCPPIDRLDAGLGAILNTCRRLSVSTNNIDRLAGLSGMERLEVLSLGRNCLKRLDGIEAVSPTLRELWVSYNQLEKLAGIERCTALKVLFASNNRLRDWGEVARLAALPLLEDLLLVGNPLYNEHRDAGTLSEYRLQVLRRIPGLKKLDGELVRAEERTLALQNQQ